MSGSIDTKRVEQIHTYWQATNYLTVAQIYLKANPLLQQPLQKEHIKSRLLGHWGTSPGLNFIYAHINRLIQDQGCDVLYVTGPGHGGPALRANVYLEGIMSELYPKYGQDLDGITRFMKDFSWPGGVPSHVSPHVPGSIHEGGELGYALAHAFGAVMDYPNLICACVVGDGEAETGPLAASWQSNKFLNPATDGAVLPILHLNQYKISGPTLFGRMQKKDVLSFFSGLGYAPIWVEGDDPKKMHETFWKALDQAYEEIRKVQKEAKEQGVTSIPLWPVIILKTPKGWTCPKKVDGKIVEGSFRSHQVPISDVKGNVEHLKILEKWMRSYHPETLFDAQGKPNKEVLEILPEKSKRMGASPYANGGVLLQELHYPKVEDYALNIVHPGKEKGEATRVLGAYVRDLFALNKENRNFRLFCPDETKSNRFTDVFEVTKRRYIGKVHEGDEDLDPQGRVLEVLSEHLCQGWLEGYLLTGRHGLFPCYEAFALIVDSMLNQHAKWIKTTKELPWRKSIASLNYVLTSHAWRQDHNGYSHQGPGFIESVIQKKASVARIYLPSDANTLLCVGEHCLKSKDYVNLIIAGKQPMPQWLSIEDAKKHCAKGASIWQWASNDEGSPDIVFASAGDVPTQEILASISLLRRELPDIKIRMVNVVDLFSLIRPYDHPHGLSDEEFDDLFTQDVHIIFAFHGHPRVIKELVHGRINTHRFHCRGYIEEGTTTTPFDMVVCNEMSRFHLLMHALNYIPRFEAKKEAITHKYEEKLRQHKEYIYEHGADLPEVVDWVWDH